MSGKILVIGATGNVGAPLVSELLARGEKVKAATRSAAARVPAGAEAVRFDLDDPSTLEPALEEVDRIYALSPAGNVDPVTPLQPLIEAAAARGIKVVLQTAIGVDADDNIPFRRLELLLERSGAPFVVLRPNWFTDNFATYWRAGVEQGEIRVPAGNGKTSFIDTRDIAAAAAGALTSSAHDGKAFVLTGSESHDYAEAAVLLSNALGRRIVYQPVDGKTFVSEAAAGGVPQDYAELLAAIFHPVAEGWTAGVTDAVQTLSGKQPRTLKASIADLAERFRAKAA
ncbi:MAG TPA: SDR family oxidoreductase [Rhizobiaceae bacterium]|nr:SDR family oxidoreductase [Rhizobiaceae bacterium]